jgi:hypothetical protein
MEPMHNGNPIQYVPDIATGKKIHTLVTVRRVVTSKAKFLTLAVEMFLPALESGAVVIENGKVVVRDMAKLQVAA